MHPLTIQGIAEHSVFAVGTRARSSATHVFGLEKAGGYVKLLLAMMKVLAPVEKVSLSSHVRADPRYGTKRPRPDTTERNVHVNSQLKGEVM